MTGVSISQDLIGHVRRVFDSSLQSILAKPGIRYGVNAYTQLVLPAYILSVAAVEAFIPESLLSWPSRHAYQDSVLWKLDQKWFDKLSLQESIRIIPQLLFGWQFETGEQPYQDFVLLVKIRNALTHYKGEPPQPPGFQRTLAQRGIFLRHKINEQVSYNPWPWDASCTEGVRWAHNVACAVVRAIVTNAPDSSHLSWNLGNFKPIPDEYVPDFLRQHGIDPSSDHPERRG